MMFIESVLYISVIAFSIILHECAHGWMANKLGDPTAKEAGRLTLNPLNHIDPLGTVILPGMLMILRQLGQNIFIFGWAKPVPVNFLRLRHPKRDMMFVGVAGPTTNILLAIFFRLLIGLSQAKLWHGVCEIGIFFNLLLAVFNMMPIPPLDGSRLVMGLLPRQMVIPYAKLERYGLIIVLASFYFGLFDYVVWPIIVYLGLLMGVSFV